METETFNVSTPGMETNLAIKTHWKENPRNKYVHWQLLPDVLRIVATNPHSVSYNKTEHCKPVYETSITFLQSQTWVLQKEEKENQRLISLVKN